MLGMWGLAAVLLLMLNNSSRAEHALETVSERVVPQAQVEGLPRLDSLHDRSRDGLTPIQRRG